MYNLYNLEPKFRNFLHAENISSVSLRNYLSDLRHFIGWLVTSNKYQKNTNLAENISSLNPDIIEEYKDRHIKSGLPHKTINRRLSALRKFFLFCQKEGLITSNPAKAVNNISLLKKLKSTKIIVSGGASGILHKAQDEGRLAPSDNRGGNSRQNLTLKEIYKIFALILLISCSFFVILLNKK